MRTRVRSRFGLVQGMCRVPGFESRGRPGRPDGRRGAGAGRRSPRSSWRSAVTTRSTSRGGSRTLTWGSAAGWPATGVLRAAVGGLSPGIRHVRPGARARSMRLRWRSATVSCSPGRTWRERGWPRTCCWMPIRLAYWLVRGRIHLALGLLSALRAVERRSAWLAARWRSGRDRGSSGKRRSFAGFSGETGTRGAALRRSRSRPSLPSRVRDPQGGDGCLLRLSTW